ncbi:peptidase associated/transthyretin-like domain-containing protein [Tenacibaculum sp. IMCC1]
MKSYIIYIIIFFTCISCGSEHILIGDIKGFVYDKTTNKPIEGVTLYTDSLSFNYFGKSKTDKNGFFYIKGMKTKDYDSYYIAIKNISYKLILESENYITDTIDLEKYDKNILDSINLKKIYLKPLEK